jgi:hypothetical protein
MNNVEKREIGLILHRLADSFERSALNKRKKFRASERAMTLAEVKRLRELHTRLMEMDLPS